MPLRFAASDVALLSGRVSWLVPVLGLGVVAAAIAYVTGIGAARRLGAKFGSFVAMAEIAVRGAVRLGPAAPDADRDAVRSAAR